MVGVILNLAVWFAIHTLFHATVVYAGPFWRVDLPVLSSADPASVLLAGAALLAVLRFGAGMIPTLLACAAAGVALTLLG